MIRQIPINGFDENFSYFLISGRDVAVVDPGDVGHLVAEIEQDDLAVKMIILTHSHFDHVAGVPEMLKKYGVPVYMHKNARGRIEVEDEMTVHLDDGDKVRVGDLHFEVLWTPGHLDDSICLYLKRAGDEEGAGRLITGDTLFVEGCGRADLEGSNVDDLWKSLQRLKKLPDEVKIYPGHDYGSKPVSTIGWEKIHNKYLKCGSLEEFRKLRLPGVWG